MRLTASERKIVEQAAKIIEAAEARIERLKVRRIHVSGLMERLKSATVVFVKKDGRLRIMKYERNVDLAHGDLTSNYKTVFDIDKQEYRKVNLLTVSEIYTDDASYKVVA